MEGRFGASGPELGFRYGRPQIEFRIKGLGFRVWGRVRGYLKGPRIILFFLPQAPRDW